MPEVTYQIELSARERELVFGALVEMQHRLLDEAGQEGRERVASAQIAKAAETNALIARLS